MTIKFISFVLLLFPGLMVFSQTGNLPVKEWTDPANKPFILPDLSELVLFLFLS